MTCPSCGAAIREGGKFCTSCGSKVKDITLKEATYHDGRRGESSSVLKYKNNRRVAFIVYIMLLFGIFYLPLIAGGVIAFLRRGAAKGTYLASHFKRQYRTAMVSFPLFVLCGLLLWIPFVGISISLCVIILHYYKTIKGFMAFLDEEAI